MAKNLYIEFNFLMKISCLFFVLLMGSFYPHFNTKSDKPTNLTFVKKDNLASNIQNNGIHKVKILK